MTRYLTVFFFLTTVFATDDKIKQAETILIQKESDGPDHKFVEDVVHGLEALTLRRSKFQRMGAEPSKETEKLLKKYREKLGPRDEKKVVEGEEHPDMRDVTLEGDMVLNPDQIEFLLNAGNRTKRAATTKTSDYWDANVIIPYQIDSSLNANIAKIRKAIQFWSDNSCLRFQENPNGKNRLRFYQGRGCWSYVGKQAAWNSQDISIGAGCESHGTICHEMLHALGFFHTQTRYDRDNYLIVYMNNINPQLRYNFEKMTPATETHFGMSYDYGSVMQYNPYAFALDYQKPTSVARDLYYQNMMGQRDGPAFSDVIQVNKLYKCSSRCSNSISCRNSGIVNSKTCNSCICPKWFAGSYCDQLKRGDAPICNGNTIKATSTAYTKANISMGIGMTYQFVDDPKECIWRIAGPSGRKLQLKVMSIDTQCREGCNWAGFEINLGKPETAGILTCCSSITNVPFTSASNEVYIRGHSRYNNANMIINYRVV